MYNYFGRLRFIIVYVFANAFYMKINKNIENTDLIQIIFFMILFFLAINEWQKAIIDAERKRTQLEMNELYYDAYDELILLIRERQHDMKSHINAILGMIYTIDNYDDLVESQKKYCDDVIGKNKETKLLLSIGNPLVAGFLFRKYQDAQKFEIEIECKVASKENNFFVPEYELIEILGILIDNAIEALSIRTVHGKKIYVEIKDTNENLQILVANISQYYGPDEICKFFQKDYSSKGKGHGIGLHKLKKVVKEKDGDIMVTNEKIDENNYLQFSIILPKKGRHS
ncbi:MAG: GHKL domain-containing protein [Lachnospiraceae bacterium]|nr:GHKL domain-containing protein [Lachnospiraceae bacterium]